MRQAQDDRGLLVLNAILFIYIYQFPDLKFLQAGVGKDHLIILNFFSRPS